MQTAKEECDFIGEGCGETNNQTRACCQDC